MGCGNTHWGHPGHGEGVRTRSDTTPANSDLVLTQYVPLSFSFPLILVPTLYASPLCPTSDYAPLVGTLVPFRMYPFILVHFVLCFPHSPVWTFTRCSTSWTRSGLLQSLNSLCCLCHMTTLIRVSPLCDGSPLYALGLTFSLH